MDSTDHFRAAERLLARSAEVDNSVGGAASPHGDAGRQLSANLIARARVHAMLAELTPESRSGVESAVEAAVASAELPTGLGAVVRAWTDTYGRAMIWTRADRESAGWASADGNGAWAGDNQLTDVVVLHPGIEVDLP
jgi:hypothetical protein